MNIKKVFLWLLCLLLGQSLCYAERPDDFTEAKKVLRSSVYADQNSGKGGDFYCGCDWIWNSKKASGGKMDLDSCNYSARKQPERAMRLEWEHVVPAYTFGRQLQCWQNGGRKACKADHRFNLMESDMHNLVPSVGEVNGDRGNLDYGLLAGEKRIYGACDFEWDSKGRVVEPRESIRGLIARTYFYMFDRYSMRLSKKEQQLFLAWDKSYPVSDWERIREERIFAITGERNAYISKEKVWSIK